MTRRASLRLRLAATVSVVVAAVVVLAFTSAYLLTERELYSTLDSGLVRQATQVRLAAQRGHATPSAECRFLAAPACSQIVTPDGSAGGGTLPVTATTRQVAAGRHSAYFSDITVDSYPARMYTAPIGGSSALQVAVRSDPTRESLGRIGVVLSVLAGLGVLVSALVGYLVARSTLRPVEQLTATAELISVDADPMHRIEEIGSDELGRLASTFNAMLARLELALTAQRQLIADASHELRTPLTSIRTNATLLRRGNQLNPQQYHAVADGLDIGIEEMIGLVGDVIDLARGDEAPQRREDVQLDALVQCSVDTAERHWPHIHFHTRLDPARITGVPQRLDRMINNLLDNAAKFSPRDGNVDVTLTVQGDRATLAVRDHGPGIDASDLSKVFQRFYRSPQARSLPGSGLGLAMVDQIAHAHDGRVSAANSVDGGALLTVELPALP